MEEGGIKGHYSHFMAVDTEIARWEAMWLRESAKVWLQAAAWGPGQPLRTVSPADMAHVDIVGRGRGPSRRKKVMTEAAHFLQEACLCIHY